MRVLITTVAIGLGAVLALLGLAAFNLHVFVDAHRDELIARGARALGRSVTIASVRPAWWPIGIRFDDVVVGDDTRFGATPFLTAAVMRVALRPGPLVLGRVEVSRLVLERPHFTLVRDADGAWNVASLGASPESDAAPPGSGVANEARPRKARLRMPLLGLASTEIRDGRIDIEDRSEPTTRRLAMTSVRLRASELRLGGDVHVRLETALFPGGVAPDARVDVQIAHVGLQDVQQTPFVARVELENADLATLATIAGRREAWAGRVERIVAEMTGGLEHFYVDLAVRSDADLRLGPHLPLPRVPVRIDARAEVVRDTVRLDHASGAFGALEWTGAGSATLRPWHVELALQSVHDSVAALPIGRPPLRLSDVAVAIVGDDVLRIAPARARVEDARVDVTAQIAGLDPLVFEGRLHATGFGGAVDAAFEGDSTTSARGRIDATALDIGAIANRWSPGTPPVTGRLDLAAVGALPWSASDPAAALSATGTLRLADGNVAAVNVAQHVLRRTPASRLLPQLVSTTTRARFPEVFEAFGTGLRSAVVPFSLAAGVITSPAVVVHADAYEIAGEASIDAQRELRFRGELVLSPELSTALREDLPPLRYLTRRSGQLVLPFHIHGPIDDPVPEPDLKRMRLHGVDPLGKGLAPQPPAGRAVPPEDEPRVQRLERWLRP